MYGRPFFDTHLMGCPKTSLAQGVFGQSGAREMSRRRDRARRGRFRKQNTLFHIKKICDTYNSWICNR